MRGLLDVVIAFWKRKTMNFRELALDGITALLGLSLFMSATSLASALNHWAARQYIRFPKMKLLPGAANAGTELNAKSPLSCSAPAAHSFVWYPCYQLRTRRCLRFADYQYQVVRLRRFNQTYRSPWANSLWLGAVSSFEQERINSVPWSGMIRFLAVPRTDCWLRWLSSRMYVRVSSDKM